MKKLFFLALVGFLSLSSCTKSGSPSVSTDDRDQYVGNYVLTCDYSGFTSGTSNNVAMTITKSSSNSSQILVGSMTATVSGNSFTFPTTTSTANGVTGTVSGSGTLSGSHIDFNYSITSSSGSSYSINYHYYGNKQ